MLNDDISRAIHESLDHFLMEERVDELESRWLKKQINNFQRRHYTERNLKNIKKAYENLLSSIFDDSDVMVNEGKGKKKKILPKNANMSRMNNRIEQLMAQNNAFQSQIADYIAMKKSQEEKSNQEMAKSEEERKQKEAIASKQKEVEDAIKGVQGSIKTVNTHTKNIVDGINFVNKQIDQYLKMKGVNESVIREAGVGFQGPSLSNIANMAQSSINSNARGARNLFNSFVSDWKKNKAMKKKMASIHKNSLILLKRIQNAHDAMNDIDTSEKSFDFQGGTTNDSERKYWSQNQDNPQDNDSSGETATQFNDDENPTNTGGTVITGWNGPTSSNPNGQSSGDDDTPRVSNLFSGTNESYLYKKYESLLKEVDQMQQNNGQAQQDEYTKEYTESLKGLVGKMAQINKLIDGAMPITTELRNVSYIEGWSKLVKIPMNSQKDADNDEKTEGVY